MNNQNNQGIPANQAAQGANPTYLADDRDRPIRSYASPNLYDFNPGIAYPTFSENTRFEIKLVMLQIIQNAGQFRRHPRKDPHDYIRNFYSICASFHMPGISVEELRFTPFRLHRDMSSP
ncbi:putative disease resistance RPP13-like protein 1 [Cucumis melo var. makuwa]|uniref:Disease resistance RPP13-like protein 1 n=1 Tax=Cucumis melo var. makuwa TaxID=1194695 RepID=A0A5A7V2U7_CUCMM|nr:putative disease resistance RPP13-like protein 1 [Cucumis melo var. makuwa]TYK26578.1 putative disease resistance RPP13-like protein 1 [Cucumis melo var. makuwa]